MGKRTMKVVKFVTEDFKSPGNYGQLDYSSFGIPIEINADSEEKGEFGRGIHVVPVNENIDLGRVIFTETMILLEVAEEDVVYSKTNGKMRVRRATPIRQLKKDDKEWKVIRLAACRLPYYAYLYAMMVDKKSTDETRTAACKDPYYAYLYAKDVDKKPTNETRIAACKDPYYAYEYTRDVDKKPTDDTRTAACQNPKLAYSYALYVDQKPTDETRTAACKEAIFAYWYAQYVDKNPTEDTRNAVCKNPKLAYSYAIDIDKNLQTEQKTLFKKIYNMIMYIFY
jgi:hypothetical protein